MRSLHFSSESIYSKRVRKRKRRFADKYKYVKCVQTDINTEKLWIMQINTTATEWHRIFRLIAHSQSAGMFESTVYGLSFIFETRMFATGDFILNGVPFEVLLSNILWCVGKEYKNYHGAVHYFLIFFSPRYLFQQKNRL